MPAINPIDALRQERAQLLQQNLMSDLPKYLAVGAAGAAGFKGLLGLYNLVRRNVSRPARTAYSPILTDVPYPQEAVEEEQRRKAADADEPIPQGPLPGPPRPPRPPSPNPPPRPRPKLAGWLDEAKGLWQGEMAKDQWSIPWAMPAAAGAATAGAFGGWRLMDYLLGKQRRKERQQDLVHAKKDYEESLLEQQLAKRAVSVDLDRLFDAWEKHAAVIEKSALLPSGDTVGQLLGAYLLAAGAGAAYTGKKTYDWVKRRQPSELLRKAQIRHRRELAASRPTPIYARPVPLTPGTPLKASPTSAELADDPLDEE
jgi:hypothetical protein